MISPDTSGEQAVNDYYEVAFDHPCECCERLQLRETKYGGSEQVDKDGIRYVDFGEVQQSISDRDGGALMQYFTDVEELYPYPNTRLKISYNREDRLPDLPSITATANLGCEFCTLLRKDLRCAWLHYLEQIRRKSSRDDDQEHGVDTTEEKSKDSTETSLQENAEDCENSPPSKKDSLEACIVLITEVEYRFEISEQSLQDQSEERHHLDCLLVHFTVDYHGKKKSCRSISTFILMLLCATWLNILRRPLPLDALSPSRLEHLDSLVEECVSRVPPPTDDLYFPTRLIDIGSDSKPDLRLIMSRNCRPLIEAEDPAKKRYVALSYCWGPPEDAKKQLTTTTGTLEDHLKQINQEKLPQTIVDAVAVCRSLGIQYLWVDALCILQDDQEDWAREAFQMSNVYASSFLTICVLYGDSCLSGFLHPRNLPPRMTMKFHSELNPSVSGKLYLSMSGKLEITNFLTSRPMYSEDAPWEDDISDSLWSTRGWTFQESQLSPRKVFFGNRMFHVSSGGLGKSEDGTFFEDDTSGLRKWHSSEQKSPSQDEGLNEWYQVAKGYATRELTYAKDRLPAVAALARDVSDTYPGMKYLAGLWEPDLHRSLLWTSYAWEPATTYLEKMAAEYVAPSWSWACRPYSPDWATRGELSFPPTFTREFQLRDAALDVEKLNPFGRVFGGHLLLSAKTFKLPFDANGKPNFKIRSDEEVLWLGVNFHYTLQSQAGEYMAVFHLAWDTLGAQHSDGYPDGPIDRLWMMLVSSSNLGEENTRSRPYLTDSEIMLGLLLLPTEREDEFIKVGLFYSETRGLGGRKFWEYIQPRDIKLV